MNSEFFGCKTEISPGLLRYSNSLNVFNATQSGVNRIVGSASILSEYVFSPTQKLKILNKLDLSSCNLSVEARSKTIYSQLIYSLLNPASFTRKLLFSKCPMAIVVENLIGNQITTKIEIFLFENVCLSVKFSYIDRESIVFAIRTVLRRRGVNSSSFPSSIKKSLLKRIMFETLLELNVHHFILIDKTLSTKDYFEIANISKLKANFIYFSQSMNPVPDFRLTNYVNPL